MELAELDARVRRLGWHHRIDLGGGLVTPGASPRSPQLEASLPDMQGRSVLDIGAWDGLYSFLAEKRGARRVVALDHYVWGVDFFERDRYWARCAAEGTLPDHGRDETDFWRPDLPGRRSFELAREALGSAVEPVLADFMTTDLDALGVFDVVLYLGVLYHVKEPLVALERVRRATGEVAVIETESVVLPGAGGDALLRFLPGGDLAGDFGNWYVPTEAALHAMCRAAGFRSVETAPGSPVPTGLTGAVRSAARRLRDRSRSRPYRLVVHARV